MVYERLRLNQVDLAGVTNHITKGGMAITRGKTAALQGWKRLGPKGPLEITVTTGKAEFITLKKQKIPKNNKYKKNQNTTNTTKKSKQIK